jgi:hypothetical protein
MAVDRRASNALYYAKTKDRIILKESELRPSTVLELIDCLSSLDLHGLDKRVDRLRQLYVTLVGEDAAKGQDVTIAR